MIKLSTLLLCSIDEILLSSPRKMGVFGPKKTMICQNSKNEAIFLYELLITV